MRIADTARDDAARAGHLHLAEGAAPRAHILVVDDDEGTLRALEALLGAEGFATSTVADGGAALAEASRVLPDVVLTDLHMQPMDGLELCKRLHAIAPNLPVIVMTADSDMHSAIESLRERAEDYLVKPLQVDSVLWSVDRAIARRTAMREQEEIQRTLNERLVLSSIREQELADAAALYAAQLTALLENLSEGVIIVDAHGGDVMINEAACTILGIAREDDRPADALDSLDVRDLEDRPLGNEQRPLGRALRGEQFTDYEVLRIRPNGERRRVASTGTSVRDENGDVALAIVVFRDVTELRRLERQRDEYLALVSHDLRNPLSVIMMSLGLLRASMADRRETKGGATGARAEMTMVERATRNANRMLVMLDELREATSLEAQRVTLRREPCDMRKVVANVVDSIDDARARRVSLVSDDASAFTVFADARRLERVLANLITNALKYSAEDAPVDVHLASKGSHVEIDVVDRGIGIAPESVTRLFERYYRTTAGTARAEGLGLGLYISRMIVELHGGRIAVSSEVGKGSTFRLVLPAHAAST